MTAFIPIILFFFAQPGVPPEVYTEGWPGTMQQCQEMGATYEGTRLRDGREVVSVQTVCAPITETNLRLIRDLIDRMIGP